VLIICWFGVRILAGAPIEISKLRTIKSCPFLPWAGCDGLHHRVTFRRAGMTAAGAPRRGAPTMFPNNLRRTLKKEAIA